MAQQTWEFDAPTGVYKSHAMSARLFEASIEDTVFVDHVRPIDGFGRGKGDTVTWTRIANITEPTSATLSETDRIPEDTFSLTTRSATIAEIGRAVPYTELSTDLSEFDLENPVQSKLRSQMSLYLDTLAATAFKDTQIKYDITGLATGTFTTTGSFTNASTENMNVYHVEEIRDYMYDTLQADTLEGGDYMAVFRTLGLRGIKRDPAWEEWHKYTDPQAKFNNELGRIEGIRFQETNHNNALGKVGTSSVLGEGVVFGADAVVVAESLTPELRAAMPGDFGRARAVAWYGQLAFKSVWGDSASAGEANVVHVGST